MFHEIFEPDYGVDSSPPDATRITQVILYFDEPDVAELKRRAKEAMKRMWPETYEREGNLSDLFLELLRNYTANGWDEVALLKGTKIQITKVTPDDTITFT